MWGGTGYPQDIHSWCIYPVDYVGVPLAGADTYNPISVFSPVFRYGNVLSLVGFVYEDVDPRGAISALVWVLMLRSGAMGFISPCGQPVPAGSSGVNRWT